MARYPPTCDTTPRPMSDNHAWVEYPDNGTRNHRQRMSNTALLAATASVVSVNVSISDRTLPIVSRYAAKNTEAVMAMISPEPNAAGVNASLPIMHALPTSASANPIQKMAAGRLRKTTQLPSPTRIGALLPSRVAFAADVFITAELNSARSMAKNTPASTPSTAGRAASDLRRPRHNQAGASTMVATSAR